MSWTKEPPKSLTNPTGKNYHKDAIAVWSRVFGNRKGWWEKPCGQREWAKGWNSSRPDDMPAEAWNFAPGDYKPGIPSTHTRGSYFADVCGESIEDRWEAFTGQPFPKEKAS